MNGKRPLIVLTGPTAVGKTKLSIALAKEIKGEIISADSMQVYRYMNIGSAKITPDEMNNIPHYLIDVLDPWEEFNVVKFQSMAKAVIEDMYKRDKIPIIAGGTGFYIQALLYDIDFADNDEQNDIREELESIGREQGNSYLHQMLKAVDPESADLIHENNQKRVIRAIEYFKQTGEKISSHNQRERQKESPYEFFYYVLSDDRDILYERIEHRVDQMIAAGLVKEVKDLIHLGCDRGMVSMQGLGYKEIYDYINGDCSLEDAVYMIKRDTRHFAKRQLTWFKREKEVRWLNLPDYQNDQEKVLQKILTDLREKWSL